MKFLKKAGYKNSEELLGYLFSDGTTNNTGSIRLAASEYKLTHADNIRKINASFEDKKLLEKLINRFLICADVNHKVKVDAFICETLNDFFWITKNEAIEFLLQNGDFVSSGVHASKLFKINYNLRYEHCREYIQVKWYSLFDDIIKIMCNRK